MIPKRLVRTVPAETTDEVERWWRDACALHWDWDHITLRDPVDRLSFPLTNSYWDTCESGAQLADLIRAEDLYWRGGVYIDSDVEVYRRFDSLLPLYGFAGYDSIEHIPNAVMGFQPKHEAAYKVSLLARDRHRMGTWLAGVGVTTEVFGGRRNDMVIFPPGSFYPIYWKMAQQPGVDWDEVRRNNPWAYCCHRAAHSWKSVVK